ncbi:MAG: DUF2334 domain-containing protein [Eubacterium sp.]|nr:DUF2334 domain-containing protein [Eubacterium sp.]
MSRYIIRLDDACQTMNHNNWDRIERLLDQYGICPIVGVIPDNKDPDFLWEYDFSFWEKVRTWQKKGWTIAMHGLHHKMFYHDPVGYYQKSHSIYTEYAGLKYSIQKKMMSEGITILRQNRVKPSGFFAPAHTYDLNTVRALKEFPEIQFISDGYALEAYKKDGMVFVPSICDGPFSFPFGVFTYVFHPSVMKEEDFKKLESFLFNNRNRIINVEKALSCIRDGQGLIGTILENSIFIVRWIRYCLFKNR